MEPRKLKVGDVLYIGGYQHRKETVVRLTNKFAVTDNESYARIEPNIRGAYEIRGSYHVARIETPELLDRFEEESVRRGFVTSISLAISKRYDIPVPVLKQIAELLKDYVK